MMYFCQQVRSSEQDFEKEQRMAGLSNRVLKKMGYLSDRRGIAERYVQHRKSWEGHLNRTKAFIRNCIPEGGKGTVAVLGSGWLLDFPLEEICQMTDRIFLYDITHPSQVIHLISKYDNVTAMQEDLTGGAVNVAYQAVRLYRKTGGKPDVGSLFQGVMPGITADLVISLNLLTQLGAMVSEYMGQHIPYTQEELDEINRIIQAQHIKWLMQMTWCLVTDVEEVTTDLNTGQVESKRMVFADLPEALRYEAWEWDFDPDGGYYPGKSVTLKVIAKALR
jgi:hypothetical protein